MRGLRALIAAVIVMGVLILLGTATLIAVVVGRMIHGAPHASAPAPASAAAAAPLLVLNGQPPGTRIASVIRESDTLLAVTLTSGGTADRLLIWDIASGRIVATLALAR